MEILSLMHFLSLTFVNNAEYVSQRWKK